MDVESVNSLIERSDLVLALGCRFSRNGTAGFRLKISEDKLIEVASFSPPQRSKYPSRLAVRTNIGEFLTAASAMGKENRPAFFSDWDKDELAERRNTL